MNPDHCKGSYVLVIRNRHVLISNNHLLNNMSFVDDDNSLIPPDSDEDIDWEEIQVEPEQHQNIEVTLQTRPGGNNNNKDKSVQVTQYRRSIQCTDNDYYP